MYFSLSKQRAQQSVNFKTSQKYTVERSRNFSKHKRVRYVQIDFLIKKQTKTVKRTVYRVYSIPSVQYTPIVFVFTNCKIER